MKGKTAFMFLGQQLQSPLSMVLSVGENPI